MATMNKYPFAKDLKVGDVVCTVSGNYLNLGIFAGFGDGTFQIYHPYNVFYWNNIKKEFGVKTTRPTVTYSKAYEKNIVKVDVNGLEDETRKEIEEAIQILIDRNIIIHKFQEQ